MDCIEVSTAMRPHEKTRFLPVVILSSSYEEQDFVKCCNIAADSYVRKPVVFEESMEAVNKHGNYRLGVNEPPLREYFLG
jgi:two-component system, response regulator